MKKKIICNDCWSDKIQKTETGYRCSACGFEFKEPEPEIYCPSCGLNTFGNINFNKTGAYIYCTECGYTQP